jgi:hypothetical protein
VSLGLGLGLESQVAQGDLTLKDTSRLILVDILTFRGDAAPTDGNLKEVMLMYHNVYLEIILYTPLEVIKIPFRE